MGKTVLFAKVNAVLRTLIALVLVGAVSTASWVGYRKYTKGERELTAARNELSRKTELLQKKEQQIAGLNKDIEKKDEEIAVQKIQIERLDTALRLMKVDHRVARLNVLDQSVDPSTKQLVTKIEFVETSEDGNPIDTPKVILLDGNIVYIDSWVVKFDDRYIEKADLHRSTSLVLFRRIFGEHQTPNDGTSLDAKGKRPRVYGQGELSEFEKKIWDDFWTIANDESKAKEIGIRAAHGDAPYIKVEKGKSYRVTLRASDGLTIKPIATAKPDTRP